MRFLTDSRKASTGVTCVRNLFAWEVISVESRIQFSESVWFSFKAVVQGSV